MNDKVSFVKSFISGGIAGCVAKTSVAPLDRIKILYQSHHIKYHQLSIISVAKEIYRDSGVAGLYRGNLMQMMRVFPYAAIQFSSFEKYKHFYSFIKNEHIRKLISGSSAGVTAVIFTYPFDFMRSNIAYGNVPKSNWKNLTMKYVSFFYGRGISSFYSGLVATLIGMIPYAGASFYIFESSRQFIIKNITPQIDKSDIKKISIVNAISGSFAGIVAQTIAYPIDVARRKIQVAVISGQGENHSTIKKALINTYKTHGFSRGLFKGMSINYIRVIPMISMSFTTYELLKNLKINN
ncbi:Mitochondrial thiamine pyrophosphate carrier 1 [Intoshia linei]|uniref:Mitochondrial thiamine pyrophosphate carrier 1 n=1 Tax=Intoshia linei TaxID=1819745 RepID=A0A177B9Y6_9BILA|nr:Mitochondrial thiamine pyrophosphate carrier 1 [Intoshia linei]